MPPISNSKGKSLPFQKKPKSGLKDAMVHTEMLRQLKSPDKGKEK